MAVPPPLPRLGPPYTAEVVRSLARCTGAIAALNARVSVSPVAKPWRLRAAWSGYTTALQLQGVEVDEIDVLSWGCGIKMRGRPLLSTHLDPFDRFVPWQLLLSSHESGSWRDSLPTAIGEAAEARDHPPLVRALDLTRQHARVDGTATPWLLTPIILCGLGLTSTPLPCLAGGVKAFRLKRTPADTDWAATFNGISRSAEAALDRLDGLERLHRRGLRALLDEYRPGALPRLCALSFLRPVLSPQSVAREFQMSVAGASKLLERAAAANLLVEISDRSTWRQFLSPDLAEQLGFVAPMRGRPTNLPGALPTSKDIASILETFDTEMEAIDHLLQSRGTGSGPNFAT